MISATLTSQNSGETSALVPAHKNSHASPAGLAVEWQAKPDGRYCLVDKQGKPVNVQVGSDKPIRIGNDLVIALQDGRQVVLKGFFLAKKPVKSTASEDDSASEDAPPSMDTSSAVYLADASEQAGLLYLDEHSADQQIPDQQKVQEAAAVPPVSANPPVLAAAPGSFHALPYVGGIVGVLALAAAGGGGGGGGAGGTGGVGGGGEPVQPVQP
ncbi:MAG: hypothetical protein ORN29_10670, partial [Rhodoferax sp.]|nr:hypothetical protein [Rhodoferax sp.]